jgi:hypothetical protein
MSDPTKSIGCSRRSFLPMLLREIAVTVRSAQGTPAHQINELGDLPDEALAVIHPIINPITRIRVIDGQVCSQRKGEEKAPLRVHFPTTPENLAVFNRINGQQTLGEIAESVAAQFGWEPERAFQHTRELFLALASYLVAVPQNSPDLEAEQMQKANDNA